MRHALLALLVLAMPASSAPELFKTTSEKSNFVLKFTRDDQRAPFRGSVSLKDDRELFAFDAGLSVNKGDLVWNDTGTAVAFSAGDQFLMSTRILMLADGKWSVVLAPAPKLGWDNFYQTPKAWRGDILSLKVDGPHAGKANGYWFSGTMEVRVSANATIVQTDSEKIEVVEQADAGQPATTSESKTGDSQKPQPESKPASR